MSDGTSLTLTFTKGGFKSDATMFLGIYDATNNVWVQVGTLSDFTETTATDGTGYYSIANFIIDTSNTAALTNYVPSVDTDGTAGVTNTPFITVAANTDPIPAGTLIQVFTDNSLFGTANGAGINADLPVVVAAAGDTNGDEVTVQVTDARDNASNALEAPKTGAAAVVKLVDGLSFSVSTVATSTIDVENTTLSRGGFVVEAGGDTPTAVDSKAIMSLNNTAEFTWSLAQATDLYTLVLDRTEGDQGVTNVKLAALPFTASTTDTSWSLTSDFTAAGLDASNTPTNFDIWVNTSNGTALDATPSKVLSTGDWKVSLKLTPDNDGGILPTVSEFTVKADVISHKWGINGMQAKVPYVYKINSAGWTSVMKFTNESATGAAADIRMDLVVFDATTGASVIPTGQEFTNVSLGTVASQGQAVYTGSAIVDAVNAQTPNTLSAATNYHFGVTFTVVAPQNSVHLAVQNKSPDSRADAPVLYNINEVCTRTNVGAGNDVESCKAGRVWQ